MAISIDWATKVISVPQADLVLVSPGVYELNLDTFRLALKDLEDSEDGMAFPYTHDHNPPVTVGGVTLARVIEIINGYTVTFEDGQYAVNLAGANSNVADVTNVNQVSVRAANSAGLTYSKQMEDLAFTDGRIWIDVDSGVTGTTYPLGTSTYPVNNYEDADDIAEARSLVEYFQVTGNLSIDPAQSLAHHDFRGATPLGALINIPAGVSTEHMVCKTITVTGNLDGQVDVDECLIYNLYGFKGRIYMCGIRGTLQLDNDDTLTTPHIIADTKSDQGAIIDCGGTGNVNLRIIGQTGDIKLTNFQGSGGVAIIDMYSGEVEIDSTCNAGTITVSGIAGIVDNSTGTLTLNTDNLHIPKDVNTKLDNNFSISAAGL